LGDAVRSHRADRGGSLSSPLIADQASKMARHVGSETRRAFPSASGHHPPEL